MIDKEKLDNLVKKYPIWMWRFKVIFCRLFHNVCRFEENEISGYYCIKCKIFYFTDKKGEV